MSQPTILMCPPDHYGIEYEINPWMSRSRQSDSQIARQQWDALCSLLRHVGAKLAMMEPIPGLPDLVFTANAGLIYRDSVILARFRHEVRQREVPYFEVWFANHGFAIQHLKEDVCFEGAGDALFCGETLIAGYRMRSDVRGHQQISELIGQQVIPLELVDPYYYHLDTCFCPLAPGQAVYFPAAFDDYGRKVLDRLVEDLIPVSKQEALRFACNAIVVGRSVITNTGCEQMHRELEQRGYQPYATPLDEFVKAGGSAKCLSLRLDGEEAATWKFAEAEKHGRAGS